jgi:hypothetical protein
MRRVGFWFRNNSVRDRSPTAAAVGEKSEAPKEIVKRLVDGIESPQPAPISLVFIGSSGGNLTFIQTPKTRQALGKKITNP